jgi:AmpD protein
LTLTGGVMTPGWLPGARRIPSPNCDERPPGEVVRLVVIHAISLPPVSSAAPESSTCLPIASIPAAHPYYAEIQALRVSSHFLSAATAI